MAVKSVAVVTGASQGIGRATALGLARDFSAVVLVARDKEHLETAASEVHSIGSEPVTVAVDRLSPARGHWDQEEAVERRDFLGALTAASLGILLEDSLTEGAHAQNTAQGGASVAGQAPFETSEVEVSGNTIFVRRYGMGPAILMVHGFPRTSLMWRFLSPRLAGQHTVICVDLRAYGRSGIPASTDDHGP
ncbi:MAG TPA: SDR family NAD(P)-dependent oxidoreductase, partial [Chloroflexota bacterium]|nr:SDR family NAD(P)-dependent oxidoreductase [Chloroflexota bacterium]